MKKYIIVSVIIIIAALIIGGVIIGNNIEVDFYFNDLYPSFVDQYIDSGDSKKDAVDKLSEYLETDKDTAEKIYKNPDNYGLLILNYKIINNTPFKIESFRFFKSTAQNNMFVLDDYFDDETLRAVKAKTDTGFSTVAVVIEKPDTFTTDMLDNCRLNIYCVSNFGLLFSMKSCYKGLSGAEQLYPLSVQGLSENDNDGEKFFTLQQGTNKNYTLYSSADCLTKSAVRFEEKADYRFSLFEDNNIKRYGFTFFDKDGFLIGGTLLNSLFSNGTFDSVKVDKSTYEDVKLIDKGACLFEKNQYSSYHYFDDGSYLKITYRKKSDNELIVSKIEKIKPDFDWLSVLEKQDYDLIKA